MPFRHLAILLALALAVPTGLMHANEDDEMLLIEDDASRIQVRQRDRDRTQELIQDAEPEATPEPTATPDPDEIFVAIVNSRVLTRADLNKRVTNQLDEIREEILSSHGGVLMTLDERNRIEESADLDDHMLLEEQERQLENAIRLEEGKEVQRWIEHSLLAEEARRQRITITDTEFRSRLAAVERETELDSAMIDSFLSSVSMTRQEYERSVYDALLIEQLLQRYIDINYDESDLRQAYNKNPSMFFEPETFQLAHFTITLSGEESSRRQSDLRNLAQEVRAQLRRGEDPDEVFRREQFDRISEGIFGNVTGWVTLREGYLPPQVQAEAQKLSVGQTSNVITQHRRLSNGRVVPNSFHVLKMLDSSPATGRDFESAIPAIRRASLEVARLALIEKLRTAGTHRVVVNLGGIPPSLIPSREDLIRFEASAEPINLRHGDSPS